MSQEPEIPELPQYSLDVQAMNLGAETNAVGLELIETESREPVQGEEASAIWAGALPAMAAQDAWVLDFFSHLDRVREYCNAHSVEFRESAGRCLVVKALDGEKLRELLGRFAGETFGMRAGEAVKAEDAALEGELSHRGLDAYQGAYKRYAFCAICELADGWVTVLSDGIWASELIRRVRPALQGFDVYIARPQ